MHHLIVNIGNEEMAALMAEARATDAKLEDVLIQKLRHTLSQPVSRYETSAGSHNSVAPPSLPQKAHRVPHAPVSPAVLGATLEERRAKRYAILKGDGPVWAGEPVRPKDGYLYEQELRPEW